MLNNLRDTYKKGCVELIILSLLNKETLYGYEMVQKTQELSDGVITIKEGSMYPTLYRLEDNGYISSKKVKVGKRMNRIYYSITESGKEYYNATKEIYINITSSVFKILEEDVDKLKK